MVCLYFRHDVRHVIATVAHTRNCRNGQPWQTVRARWPLAGAGGPGFAALGGWGVPWRLRASACAMDGLHACVATGCGAVRCGAERCGAVLEDCGLIVG